jgi:hypothetical protein
MRSSSLAVVVIAACGSGSHNLPSPAPPISASAPSPPPPRPEPAITPEVFCDHFQRLTSKCEQLANAAMDPATCLAETGAALASSENKIVTSLVQCLVRNDDCDAVMQCIAEQTQVPDEHKTLRACDDRSPDTMLQAVGIPQAAWDQRNGAHVVKLRDARSTKETPIEMCGAGAANRWLISLRCDDGSQPLESINDAERARAGNVGPGGRCQSIIDRYEIPCPERSYTLFIDDYVCPLPR